MPNEKSKLLRKPSNGLSDACYELLSEAVNTPIHGLKLFEKYYFIHNIIDLAYKLGCNKKRNKK